MFLFGVRRRRTKGERSPCSDFYPDRILRRAMCLSVSWRLLVLDRVLFCSLIFRGHSAPKFTPVRPTVITGQQENCMNQGYYDVHISSPYMRAHCVLDMTPTALHIILFHPSFILHAGHYNISRIKKKYSCKFCWQWGVWWREGFPGDSDGKESACNAGDPGCDPWVREGSLEEGMATHSSILAWGISWTGKPRGLESM